MNVPPCKDRGQAVAPDIYICKSSKLVGTPMNVIAQTCLRCPYSDEGYKVRESWKQIEFPKPPPQLAPQPAPPELAIPQDLTKLTVEQRKRFGFDDPAGPVLPQRGPSIFKKAINLSWAVASHILAGLPTVDDKDYEARLNVCNSCEMRKGNTCMHPRCGCNLSLKAWWKDQKCPLDKWAKPES